LQGPKFRTGKIEGGSIQLENGSKLLMKFSKEEVGNAKVIIVPHQTIMKNVKDGEKILLDDGTMELK
jgi:pyruvate kinase